MSSLVHQNKYLLTSAEHYTKFRNSHRYKKQLILLFVNCTSSVIVTPSSLSIDQLQEFSHNTLYALHGVTCSHSLEFVVTGQCMQYYFHEYYIPFRSDGAALRIQQRLNQANHVPCFKTISYYRKAQQKFSPVRQQCSQIIVPPF